MHVPDHMLNDPTEAIAALGAAAALAAVALRPHRATDGAADARAGRHTETLVAQPDRLAPQAATAALVFGLQMVNVPVLSGTSGHLLGGALATALVGPRRALLAVSAVVATQALLFADGGVGALGVNLWLIAILPVAVAAAARAVLRRRAPGSGPIVAAVPAALLAPAASALAFAGLHSVGGTVAVDGGELITRMVGVHLAIGVAEALLTVAVLGAVVSVGERAVPAAAVLSSAALSLLASSAPDGLERVAGDLGFAVTGSGSVLEGRSPLAGYVIAGTDGTWSAAAAGVAGALLAAALLALVAVPLRRPLAVRSAQSNPA